MQASEYVARLNEACQYVKTRIQERPGVGIILGSGLGSFGEVVENAIKIPYKDIPQMLDTTVPGHSGCLIFGKIGDRKVLCLSGRSHQYEGLYPHEVQFAIRLLALVGCKLCILTNAAGTRDPELNVGHLAPIEDHTNFTHRGYTEEPLKFKPFNHMIQSNMIDEDASKIARQIAQEMKFDIKGCIYCYNFGPTYESTSEVEGEYRFGATNFGMSTVPEIIAMKELNVPIFAMSFVTNKAAGVGGVKLSHEDVQIAAKAGEPNMKALISELIKRVPLKDFPIPQIEGDNHIISRVLPKDFVSDQEISDVLNQFNGSKIDAVIVLGGCHSLTGIEPKFEVVKSIDCNQLPYFPIMEHTELKFDLGTMNGHQIGIFHNFFNLNGPQEHALYYITKLAKALGASTYIQTFSSGAYEATSYPNVSLVEDIIPIFEKPVRTPVLCRKPFDLSASQLSSFSHCILASYHGPEFPTPHESNGIHKCGAQQITLGSLKGLLLANALGLKPYGVADGAYKGTLGTDPVNDKLDVVLQSCRNASKDVFSIVSAILSSVQSTSNGVSLSFTENPQHKAIQWNDCQPERQNEQEDPDLVDAVAQQLPKNEKFDSGYVSILLENESIPYFNTLKSRLENSKTIVIHDQWLNVDVNVYIGSLKLGASAKNVVLSTKSRTLVRALSQNLIRIVIIGAVFPIDDKLRNEKLVTICDHVNLDGLVPLVGRNKSGDRFPDMSHLYSIIEGLPQAVAYNVVNTAEVTAAYGKAIRLFGGDVQCEFGVEEAVVTRHAKGLLSFLGVVLNRCKDEWVIDDEILAKAL